MFDTGGMPRYSKGDPDRILGAKLNGRAQRLAADGGSIRDAAADLEAMAHGRRDLVAHEAGIMAGSWSVRGGTGNYLVAAGLLVMAGADHDQLQHWIDIGRQRSASRFPAAGRDTSRPDYTRP
jgi:hypothetical protein